MSSYSIAQSEFIEKKLIWLCDESFTSNVNKEIFDKFNKILIEKYECNFTVEFVGLKSTDYDSYQTTLRGKKEQGEQVDIMFTGVGMIGKAKTYDKAIEDDLLLPISDALVNTDYGKQLYEVYDEKLWDIMKYKGTIYGFRPKAELTNRVFIVANKKYCQSAFTSDKVTFDVIGNILEGCLNNNEMSADVLPMFIDNVALCNLEGYIQIISGYDGIYFKEVDGQWKFVNGANEERIQMLWKKIKEYETLYNYQGGDALAKLKTGQFCISIMSSPLIDLYNGTYMGDIPIDITELNSTWGYIGYPYNAVTGIASWSNYPEESMQLLSLIATKADLSNLLAFGIKGTNYSLEDNKPIRQVAAGRVPGYTISSPANRLITYSEDLEPNNKVKIYEERNKETKLSPEIIYQLDYEDYKMQIYEIAKIYSQYAGLWTGEYEDIEKTIKELQESLNEAGIDELLKKLNTLLHTE
jgi:putative aldouronate transport system substrate-binding protein